MEFLVTMTTHVPAGTPEAAVEDVKSQEAAHSLELAAQGRLLRLWRPPLKPGEWRTLGLFEAFDRAALDAVLLSMPLRVWRTDEIVALGPHPNDPGERGHGSGSRTAPLEGAEFFTTFTVAFPPETPRRKIDDVHAREATRARELAEQGHLVRLWNLPGEGRALGLWRASDAAGMASIVDSLPLRPWFDVETVPLSVHPSDPAAMHA
jgi:muconolactone delta-isomerase